MKSHLRAWNKYFASAGQRVQQSALRAGHSQFVPVFSIWYTIEFWKPDGHCDCQKMNPACHTWNRAGRTVTDDRRLFHALHLFNLDQPIDTLELANF